MNVNLGSNIITNCDAALVVNGIEVFRLRERTSDGRLVCDLDLLNEAGDRLAKVAKDKVVYAAEGYEVHERPRECSVEAPDGGLLVRVRETRHDELSITGNFWAQGFHVVATDDALNIGGNILRGNRIDGFGRAISLRPGEIAIGVA